MNNKSHLLDELRLEIGLVREQVQTLSSFYIGITRKFASRMTNGFSVSIYEATDRSFNMKVCAGSCYLKRSIPLGEGILSLVAIRGDLVYQIENQMQKVFLPFYKQHNLLGIIVFYIPKDTYEVTEDDLIFIKEIGRFIEVQHATFHPHPF